MVIVIVFKISMNWPSTCRWDQWFVTSNIANLSGDNIFWLRRQFASFEMHSKLSMNCHICPINNALTKKDKERKNLLRGHQIQCVDTAVDHRWRPITALVSSICYTMYYICVLPVIPYWTIGLYRRPHRDIRWCPFYFDYLGVAGFRRHRSCRSNKRILENKKN